MLKQVIAFSLTRRALVLAVLVLFLGAGVVAFQRLNIEAYPDPSPPIMEILTQSPGQSAETSSWRAVGIANVSHHTHGGAIG